MKMRPLFIVLGLIVALPILIKLRRYNSDAGRIGKVDVDLSGTADGVHSGAYDSGPVVVNVDVTVKDHAITDIKLVKHRNGQGAAAESITGTVVSAQSIKVDVVSGATMSSKVILLAIEDALKGK